MSDEIILDVLRVSLIHTSDDWNINCMQGYTVQVDVTATASVAVVLVLLFLAFQCSVTKRVHYFHQDRTSLMICNKVSKNKLMTLVSKNAISYFFFICTTRNRTNPHPNLIDGKKEKMSRHHFARLQKDHYSSGSS